MKARDSLIVFVFSFNRGRFLLNCIKSIDSFLDGFEVVIVDDESTDKDTQNVLAAVSKRHRVLKNDGVGEYEEKTGGLAGSMNMAMAYAAERGYEYALFIQDDMQLVRPVLNEDFSNISSYFDKIINTIQLSSTFVRKLSSGDFLNKYDIRDSASAYIRIEGSERGKSNFSATGVFSVSRFHRLFGRFEVGEAKNSAKAISLGLTCGRSIYPFMCWLPYPSSFRGKKKNLKHRFFEHFGRSGFYPIKQMSDTEVETFLRRNPSYIPVMEEFLYSPSSPRHDVWSTGGGEYNFLGYGGALSKLFLAAKSTKKLMRDLGL
ncbi:MAG TPA: glycosyltransferase [Marinobacter salarius]|jgi:glycosyltransferase involved in cell wall biosynthesis|uniref:glycosyltransferase family A protein n=1 Tax=Marinobacter salarius TaxID=1420917 RepID=UPI000C0F065F|nr:glycosyltransferase [Marinobacter salarius]PHR10705.1 MAG: hypothetical protein COA41_20690 [Sphingopyxis sp.]HIP01438.1 glycosyltransferase [Marinobacter salarius]|tara:strand:+ start:606 stop:1559 length:954 start_codon:yes stop_codon:yes gene_type:complete